MTARGSDSGYDGFVESCGVGVRTSPIPVLAYELAVVADDVADAVRSAGGWMYDRVRAGWKVTAFLPAGCDTSPLEILGVQVVSEGSGIGSPAALALAVGAFTDNEWLRTDVLEVLHRGGTELTLWGDPVPAEISPRVGRVHHRLSGAARIFKEQARIAVGPSSWARADVEEFHSCDLWYPTDGPDLVTVG